MDTEELKLRAADLFKKYRFVLVVLLAGVILMTLPEKKQEQPAVSITQEPISASVQDSLEEILSRIQGAGKVNVLLTEYKGKETLYQTDTQRTGDSLRTDTVLVSGADREDSGLVRQVNPPVYLGALVVCQGGDRPGVKLAIVEAVMSVTGLSSDKITVLKMK